MLKTVTADHLKVVNAKSSSFALPERVRVSAVIITYNEEHNIRKTLSQLYWCDEIIIVDSYSTDETVSICKEYDCRVFSKRFAGYGPQKQYGVSLAKNDWVLCIDADEVLTEELVNEINSDLQSNKDFVGYSFPLNLVFLDKEFNHGKESRRHFTRLFNKNSGGFTADKVHESIRLNGPVKKLQHIVQHYSYSSIRQLIQKHNTYSSYSAEMAFKKGKNKSMFAVLFGLPFNFFKYYLLEMNFMNGPQGFYWSVYSTYYHFSKYVKLRELNSLSKKSGLTL